MIAAPHQRSAVGAALMGLLLLSACSSGSPETKAATTSSTPTTSSVAPATTRPTAPATPIPAQYQALSDSLGAGLDAYQRAIDALPNAPRGTRAPVLATEVLPANGNRLTVLLQPATMAGVDAWLDRLQAMGFGGVTLGEKLPMLRPEFGPDSDAYTTFFATVADKARAHGMAVDVELGALFCGTVYAACSYSYDGGYQAFVDTTVAQARIVIERIKPDYLTVLAEPTTEATLARVPEFLTADGSARYVHDVLAGIGDRGSTKVGAGAATWLDPSYNEAILREPVDYLALHIYPVTAHTTDILLQDTKLAQKSGKPIVADEVGLYKVDASDQVTPATADTAFRRDVFSFFEPLDIRFATITSQWAKKSGVAFVSPYWTGEFFSYIDWTPDLDTMPYPQLTETANAEVRRAFLAQEITDYGRAWLAGS